MSQGFISLPDVDLSLPLFSDPNSHQPMFFDSMSSMSPNFGFGFDTSGCSSDKYGTIASPQEIFGRQDLAYLEDGPHIEEAQPPVSFAGGTPNSPPMKIESTSQMSDDDDLYCEQVRVGPLPVPRDEREIGTDVDTLMRAIQTKSTSPAQMMQPPRPYDHEVRDSSSDTISSAINCGIPIESKSKRRYPCRIPSCAKIFTQKTHLEIHMRAHTGQKPYVRSSRATLLFKSTHADEESETDL